MSKIIVGPPAKGEGFFNREKELKIIWHRIKNNHLLLAAPRRFGKTSIMLQMNDKPLDGYSVYFIDIEGFSEPEELLAGIAEKILEKDTSKKILKFIKKTPSKIWTFVKETIGEVELSDFKFKFREKAKENWKEFKLVHFQKKMRRNLLLNFLNQKKLI